MAGAEGEGSGDKENSNSLFALELLSIRLERLTPKQDKPSTEGSKWDQISQSQRSSWAFLYGAHLI